nr:retrotransposon protein, putative, Ty1-copia subclass [Tanacetum cinerariifolium]
GFKEERKLSYGVQYLQVGNGTQAAVEAIGIAISVNGVFEIDMINNTCPYWQDSKGLLENIDEKSFDKCESCISGKMTKKPFNKNIERATYLLGLIHTDVCDHLDMCQGKQNGVSERRNRTLLDMVRSMFNLTTIPLSFWDYAFESAVHILNMVPTKKVDKTPYEIWHGKAPNFGRVNDLKDDHMDILPSENTSEIPVEPESLGPSSELIPVRRSESTTRAPNRLCLNMKVEDDEVGDLGEPANY